MALTSLPEEVLEQIIKNLSVKDIIRCSAVNLAWREKFNVDVFWKRFCTKEIKNYLENTPCQVDPQFVIPDEREERLQPLCYWRICYMREVHLINNWKSQKCTLSQFRSYVGVVSSDVLIDGDGIHWLFLRTSCEIEIWNVHIIPQLYTTIPMFEDCPNVSIFVAGKQTIITQWNIVSVYDLENKEENVKILSRFVLDDDKFLPITLWNTTDKENICLLNEVDDFKFLIFGNILVGYKRIPNPLSDLSMHLWDIISGKKLKIDSMLHSLWSGNEIASSNIFKIDTSKGLIRLVFYSPQSPVCSQLFGYDFKKQTFTNTNIMFSGVVVWCGCTQNIIITFSSHPGTIRFYNYFSGKLLSSKEIGEYSNSEQMQLIDSYLLYCTFNCMNVLDIHKQEVVYCLQFSFYSFVRRLTVIEPRFVVVWLLERGGRPGCPSYHQEVWDMKDLSNKMFQCLGELGFEMITPSSSIVKQVITSEGMINLFTFW